MTMTQEQKLEKAKTLRNQAAGIKLRTNLTPRSVVKQAWQEARNAYEAAGLSPQDLGHDCRAYYKKYTPQTLTM